MQTLKVAIETQAAIDTKITFETELIVDDLDDTREAGETLIRHQMAFIAGYTLGKSELE